ncbi:MAG: low molecular weight phosphatase family protein [Halopenitus sp.]
MTDDRIRVALMCVRNAGRSQMATAFAERERDRRDLGDAVAILTGGTAPADHVHSEVITVMEEVGFDLSDRSPQGITTEKLESSDYVATMGCSTLDLDASRAQVDVRDWALTDPEGEPLDRVRDIRDEVESRVKALFDEVEAELADRREQHSR